MLQTTHFVKQFFVHLNVELFLSILEDNFNGWHFSLQHMEIACCKNTVSQS